MPNTKSLLPVFLSLVAMTGAVETCWVLLTPLALAQTQSDFDEALEDYNQALPIYRAIQDRAGEVIALDHLGYLLQQQNQPQLAIIFYKQSVNVYPA